MNRRQFLRIGGLVGSTGFGGCLRLTQSNDNPSTATSTVPTSESKSSTNPSSTEQPTTKQLDPIQLKQVTRLSPAGGDIARHKNDFFVNDTLVEQSNEETGHVWRVTADGEVVWKVKHSQSVHQQQQVSHFSPDTVYWGYKYLDFLGSKDERVAKVVSRSLETGEKEWEFAGNSDDSNNLVASIVQPSSNVVAFGTSGIGVSHDEAVPTIYGVDVETGEERWRTTFSSGFIDSMVLHDGDLYAIVSGAIYRVMQGKQPSLVLETGKITNNLSHREDMLYFGQSDLHCVSLNAMSKRWSTSTNGQVRATSISEQGLFIGTETGFVARFEPTTGEKMWESRVNNSVNNLGITSRYVWVPDGGTLKAFRTTNGEKDYQLHTASASLETIGDTLCYRNGSDEVLLQEVRES